MSAIDDTLDRVRQLVASVLRVPLASVDPAMPLGEIAALDSLTLAEIATAIDEEFRTRLPSDDLNAVQSVAELAALVERAPRR